MSFLLSCFKNQFQNSSFIFSSLFLPFFVHLHFHFFYHKLHLLFYLVFQTTSLWFSHRRFHNLLTYHFWISFLLFFSHSFNKEELVNITRGRTITASIASRPCGFDPLSQCYNGSIEGILAHIQLH